MEKTSLNTILDSNVLSTYQQVLDMCKTSHHLTDYSKMFAWNEVLDSIKIPDLSSYSVEVPASEWEKVLGTINYKLDPEDNFEVKFFSDKQVSTPKAVDDIIKKEAELSTSASAQRQLNIDLLQEFNKKNAKFVYLLHHTNFEDAQENEATQFFAQLYKQDPCISLFWLNGVYTDNQKDVAVLEGILRIISMLDAPEYRKYILPMVKASFNDTHVEVQEAAIMVAENWRNKMCLDALTSTQFASNWIKDYANQVIEELREELADEISQDD